MGRQDTILSVVGSENGVNNDRYPFPPAHYLTEQTISVTGSKAQASNPIDSQPGFRAAQWRVLLATMVCYLFYYTGRQTLGFAIPGIEKELGLSKTELGLAGLVLLWSYALGQAINGNLGDKFGGRRMMSLGAILSCAFNWITSFAGNLPALLVPWSMNGYSQAMGWAPGSRVLANWWGRHERGMVYGLYVFASGLSSILAFTTSLLILDTFELNWRWIFRGPVLLLLVGGVFYYLIVRDRPEDLGFVAPEEADETEEQDNLEQVDVCAQCGHSAHALDSNVCPECGADLKTAGAIVPTEVFLLSDTSLKRYLHVISNGRFIIASLALGFQGVARYGLLTWVPVHFLSESWKEESGGEWISLALAVGMAIGALTGGFMSDHVFKARRSPLITSSLSIAAVGALALYFLPREYQSAGIVLLFLCGFFVFGSQPAYWALCPDLLGRRRAGTGTGVMNMFQYGFAGVGQICIGWMIETYKIPGPDGTPIDNTAIVFLITAAVCLIGAVISVFIRR